MSELRVQRTDSGRGLLPAVRRQLKGLECGYCSNQRCVSKKPWATAEAKLHHQEHLKEGEATIRPLLCELAPASTGFGRTIVAATLASSSWARLCKFNAFRTSEWTMRSLAAGTCVAIAAGICEHVHVWAGLSHLQSS